MLLPLPFLSLQIPFLLGSRPCHQLDPSSRAASSTAAYHRQGAASWLAISPADTEWAVGHTARCIERNDFLFTPRLHLTCTSLDCRRKPEPVVGSQTAQLEPAEDLFTVQLIRNNEGLPCAYPRNSPHKLQSQTNSQLKADSVEIHASCTQRSSLGCFLPYYLGSSA